MAEIIQCYRQSMPAHRFIGKMYGDADRKDGSFGSKWGEWFQNDRFKTLEQSAREGLEKLGAVYEDNGAYTGLMRRSGTEPFQYWIGLFFAENTPVPEGFESADFAAGELGTCWIYGKASEGIFDMHEACAKKLQENNFSLQNDFGNGKDEYWFFERYGHTRFTAADEKGCVILDYCFYIQ